MRKFSKILESSESTLLSKIGSSEDEIRDICSDMIDEGYKSEIVTKYLGLDGRTYYDEKGTIEYYPCISVSLIRKDKEESEISMWEFTDVRNWDGGVYYEGDINILKIIYNVCVRFESTFTSDEAEVYCSIRSINDIVLRICFKRVIGEAKIKFSELHDSLPLNITDDYYRITNRWQEGNGTTTHVELKSTRSEIEKLVQLIISNGSSDDYHYLDNIMKDYTISVFNKTKELSKSDVKITYKILGSNQTYDFTSKIYADDEEVIKIIATYSESHTGNVVISKSLFREKTKKVTLHDVDFKVIISK